MGTTLGMNYALDCHQEVSFIRNPGGSAFFLPLTMIIVLILTNPPHQLSVEAMITIAALKSVIAWVWT
jgi:hypothetical protein